MLYQFCKWGNRGYLEFYFSHRYEVERWVVNHWDEIQSFSVYESGHIVGYAVELLNDKPIAILYFDKIGQFIWIDMT